MSEILELEAFNKRINWKRCCLCQEEKKDSELRHPYKSTNHHHGYWTVENDIKAFIDKKIDLPVGINPESLNDGSGIAATLLQNEARYHHSCRTLLRNHFMDSGQC
jgi:hypothetical protein